MIRHLSGLATAIARSIRLTKGTRSNFAHPELWQLHRLQSVTVQEGAIGDLAGRGVHPQVRDVLRRRSVLPRVDEPNLIVAA